MDTESHHKPGPDPERLKLEGDWEDRMAEALGKPVPPEGIPDQPGKGTKPRKNKGPGEKPEPEGD